MIVKGMDPPMEASLQLGPGVSVHPPGSFKAKSSIMREPLSDSGIEALAGHAQAATVAGLPGWVQLRAMGCVSQTWRCCIRRRLLPHFTARVRVDGVQPGLHMADEGART
jgi:hypothetical protein